MRLSIKRTDAGSRFAHSGGPDRNTPWRQAEWCAIDLELTGLHRSDEIIAIGAVPIRDGSLILGEAMYTLARPEHPPKHASVLVHKLRSVDLREAPPLDEAIDQLLQTLAGRVPVFHTAMVERAFLGRELRRRRLRLPDDVDTEVLVTAVSSLNAEDAARVRSSFTAFGCCGVLDPLHELEALGLVSAKETHP